MSSPYSCPRCGETEALRGEREGEDITVACLRCGERWNRGAPRCKTCGLDDVLTAKQAMSRHPRGNQLAIVGWREILLCRHCDARVAAEWVDKNRRVPEGYVSKAVLDATATPPAPETPVDSAPRARKTGQAASPVPRREPTADKRPTPPTPPATPPATARPTDPTVRQAVEAFLMEAGPTADSTAMLMLGTHLGSATRLSELTRPDTPEKLTAWFERLYSGQDASHLAARATVVAAVDHWRDQGWLSTDPAARLRSGPDR